MSPPEPRGVRSEPQPLSVLYVVHGFPPDSAAGTELYTLGLAREMQSQGLRVTVLARAPAERSVADGGPPDWTVDEGELDGLRVLRVVRRVASDDPIGESYAPREAPAVFRDVLRRLAPDVVHFQHLLHLSAELPLVTRELGIPSLITCNDYWALCARVQMIRPDGVRCEENQELGCHVCLKGRDPSKVALARRWYPWLDGPMRALDRASRLARGRRAEERPARGSLAHRTRGWIDLAERQQRVLAGFAAADLVIAPSRFLRQKLLDTGRFDPARVVHSDYGMRVPEVAPPAKTRDPKGRLRVGFVGSLVWYKGVDVAIEAVRRLAGRPCVLHVHGAFNPASDEHHAKLASLARDVPVVFHGPFANDGQEEVFREIDVLVVPSLWFENSPLAIHEAWIHRTPVVASGIGGMAELVRDGVDGLHFRAGDAADLAAKLARFLDEPGLAARLASAVPPVKSLAEDAREQLDRYRTLVARGGVAPMAPAT